MSETAAPLSLRRERTWAVLKHDANAMWCVLDGMDIGYICRSDNVKFKDFDVTQLTVTWDLQPRHKHSTKLKYEDVRLRVELSERQPTHTRV